MAVQKSRKSRAKKGSRRHAHSALTTPSLSVDPTTGSTHRRHHLSSKDGYYKGRQIIVVNEVMEEE